MLAGPQSLKFSEAGPSDIRRTNFTSNFALSRRGLDTSHARTRPAELRLGPSHAAHLKSRGSPMPFLNKNSRSMGTVPTEGSIMYLSEMEAVGRKGRRGREGRDRVSSLGSDGTSRLGVSPAAPRSKTNKLLSAMRRPSSHGRRRELGLPEQGMYSTAAEFSTPSTPSMSRATSPARYSQPPTIEQIAMGLHLSRTPHLGPSSLGTSVGSDSAIHHSSYQHYRLHPLHQSPSRPGTATSSSSTRVAVPLRSSLKTKTSAQALEGSRSTSPSGASLSASSMPPTPGSRSRSALSRISSVLSGNSLSSYNSYNPNSSSSQSVSGSGSGRSRLERFLWRGLKSPVPGSKSVGARPGTGSLASLNSSDTELSAPRKAVRFMGDKSGEETVKVKQS